MAKQRNLEHALHLEAKDYHTKIILDDLVISDLKWWLYAIKYMNGIPLTWVFSNPRVYHDKIWTDAALEEKEMIGGMGGWSESGVAYQIDIRQTDARAVAKKRTGLDIKLFETLGSYVLIAHMAPQWQYKNIKMYCDNKKKNGDR